MTSKVLALFFLATLLIGILTNTPIVRANEDLDDEEEDENEMEEVKERELSIEEMKAIAKQRPLGAPWEMTIAQLETFKQGKLPSDCSSSLCLLHEVAILFLYILSHDTRLAYLLETSQLRSVIIPG